MYDEDIKIAGESAPASDRSGGETEYRLHVGNGNIDKARALGKTVAEITVSTAAISDDDGSGAYPELQLQRGVLLAFSAVMTLETAILPGVVEDVAKQEFYAVMQRLDPCLYKETTDSGAFSFYYLAYRRGIELERRIGQTFAMLCSHDGDPVYQELGEALFCWMRSKTEQEVTNIAFIQT